ncbi:Transcriptional regulatory protein ZraR [Nitrospira japonica]|uniref:DNA-binding transcriptional regulator NtrC n=1 Tax=Nitrospira japonica TaxID=1325564 RepID=A0A1W1I0K4_9BACT|nr:sigma-54 dependent transcriptional regulator [Nitrospira japonica]SLM46383.1 Transcriptional regulatory protein ZraR [Nitrospira japonica]
MKARILIVDDDPDIATMLEDRLQASDYGTLVAQDGVQALELIEQEVPKLMLLDLDMPRLTGLEVLKRLPKIRAAEDLPVIVMTAHGSIEAAVEAMKSGAYDFLTKPLDKDHLLLVIQKALERDALKRQVACLKSEIDGRYTSIIGTSPNIRSVMEAAQRAAKSDAGVLLLGESGTGKELFARSIHQWSPRRVNPMIVINCVALTETLLENELFGHERGAFTGADRLQKGKLEMADGGTVFLDEIGDMPMALQAKLLRVLQDREFHRVGGTRLVSVNIRIIAATNKDLKQAVKNGHFREDLYFRLNVITLTLPPLRDRPDDLPLLAKFFLNRHAKEAKRYGMMFHPEAMNVMMQYTWPGNIRELDNVIARAVILSPTEIIEPDLLVMDAAALSHPEALTYVSLPYHRSMEEHSRHIIDQALKQAEGNQTKAAERLRLQRTYLARLIKQQKLRQEEV